MKPVQVLSDRNIYHHGDDVIHEFHADGRCIVWVRRFTSKEGYPVGRIPSEFASLDAVVNSKLVTTYAQDTNPNSTHIELKEGDLWLEPISRITKRWNGEKWEYVDG